VRSADRRIVPQEQVELAPLTTLGVGGRGRWFVRAETAADVARAHQWAQDAGTRLLILGGGSNVVIADEGVDGLVLQIALPGTTFVSHGADTLLTAGAGERWDGVVAAAVARGLAGLECLSGIPGTVGGTPIQNVGAYGQEVAGSIERVVVYDTTTGDTLTLTAADCRFAYRSSRFKQEDAGRFIVCSVLFRLRAAAPTVTYPDIVNQLERAGVTDPSVAAVRDAVLAVRTRKGMVIDAADPDTRSVGSFFMNPIVTAAEYEHAASLQDAHPPAFPMADGRVKVSAAWLIEHAGFARGEVDGAVGISSKHTLALINRGGATARDVLRLATRIKRHVGDRFGIWLRPEPLFVGFDGDPDVEYLVSVQSTN
jgi:UDP-N-acetylmuramate dehydrogenase